jgi:hypothetical protein
MADTVQFLLEEQIPELEEYERKGALALVLDSRCGACRTKRGGD